MLWKWNLYTCFCQQQQISTNEILAFLLWNLCIYLLVHRMFSYNINYIQKCFFQFSQTILVQIFVFVGYYNHPFHKTKLNHMNPILPILSITQQVNIKQKNRKPERTGEYLENIADCWNTSRWDILLLVYNKVYKSNSWAIVYME